MPILSHREEPGLSSFTFTAGLSSSYCVQRIPFERVIGCFCDGFDAKLITFTRCTESLECTTRMRPAACTPRRDPLSLIGLKKEGWGCHFLIGELVESGRLSALDFADPKYSVVLRRSDGILERTDTCCAGITTAFDVFCRVLGLSIRVALDVLLLMATRTRPENKVSEHQVWRGDGQIIPENPDRLAKLDRDAYSSTQYRSVHILVGRQYFLAREKHQ